MSLINDALKKAQKQRETTIGPATGGVTPTGTPPAPPGPPPPAAPAASPAGPNGGTPPPAPVTAPSQHNNVAVIAGAAVIVSLSVAATVYFLRGDKRAEGPVAVTPPPAAMAPSSPPPKTEPVAPSLVPTAPSMAATPPPIAVGAPPSSPAAATAGNLPPPTAPVLSTQAPSTVPATPVASPAESPISDPLKAPPLASAAEPAPRPTSSEGPPVKTTFRIQGMIDKFRISGIRLSPTESKVILNDHLFRVDDLVEPTLGLRLTKIESHLLTFSDADGNSYLKRF